MKEFAHPKYPTIHIKLLKGEADFNQLETLMATNNASAFDLTEFTPDSLSIDTKYLYGIFDAVQLIGVIDLIEDYPTKQTTYIHEFLIHCDTYGEDLKETLYTALEKTAQETGTTNFELDKSLVDSPFFKKLDFDGYKKSIS